MNSTNEEKKSNVANRGFASMDSEQQRAIARKGGNAVSRNREHMAEIGRKGGNASGTARKKRKDESNK
jgi:general stress protein YciG